MKNYLDNKTFMEVVSTEYDIVENKIGKAICVRAGEGNYDLVYIRGECYHENFIKDIDEYFTLVKERAYEITEWQIEKESVNEEDYELEHNYWLDEYYDAGERLYVLSERMFEIANG